MDDVKHKTALLLKQELPADSRWAEFVTKSNNTKLSLTQTSWAFLNPPVLESLIGKYKRLQSTHSKGGLSAMLLSFGVVVCDKTADAVRRALETIHTEDVYDWVKNKPGITIQTQRKLAFERTKAAHKTQAIPTPV